MKKLIAILLLFVVGLNSLPISKALQDYSYEHLGQGEQAESECKEDKKEHKDYLVHSSRNQAPFFYSNIYSSNYELSFYLRPVLDKQTPPPDGSC